MCDSVWRVGYEYKTGDVVIPVMRADEMPPARFDHWISGSENWDAEAVAKVGTTAIFGLMDSAKITRRPAVAAANRPTAVLNRAKVGRTVGCRRRVEFPKGGCIPIFHIREDNTSPGRALMAGCKPLTVTAFTVNKR